MRTCRSPFGILQLPGLPHCEGLDGARPSQTCGLTEVLASALEDATERVPPNVSVRWWAASSAHRCQRSEFPFRKTPIEYQDPPTASKIQNNADLYIFRLRFGRNLVMKRNRTTATPATEDIFVSLSVRMNGALRTTRRSSAWHHDWNRFCQAIV